MAGNRDQAHGIWTQLKGRVKRVFGRATGDRSTELKGGVQEVGGKIQEGFGNLREDLKAPKQQPRM